MCWRRWSVCVVLVLAGCQQSASPAPPPPAPTGFVDQPSPSADQAVGSDPSASRLQNIGGAILEYYMMNHRLPDKLEEVTSFSDAVDGPVILQSPENGQEFVYVPSGLWISGKPMGILAYDPAVAKNGRRWCLLMAPIKPHGTADVDVVAVQEAVFKMYKPPGQTTSGQTGK